MPSSDPDVLADLLERAADKIDVHGHIKGRTGNPREGYCLWGSLLAASEDENYQQRVNLAHDALLVVEGRRHYGPAPATGHSSPSYECVRWNDLPTTTPGDVTDALRLAAKDLR